MRSRRSADLSVVVNYSPFYAIHYDRRGNEIEVLDRAYRLGEISFSPFPLSEDRSPIAVLPKPWRIDALVEVLGAIERQEYLC